MSTAIGDAERLAALERELASAPDNAHRWFEALRLVCAGRIADDRVGAAHSLGGLRPFRVAVVTAYCAEDIETLARCHRSVSTQTYPCHHVLVADGKPRTEVDAWDATHIRLPGPSRDYGDTPRCRGGQSAAERGFDAVAYLDADNSYRPRHIEALAARCVQSGAAIGQAGRTLHLPDGRLVPAVLDDDFTGHVDTSCLFVTKPAFELLGAWLRYPRRLSLIGDRMVVQMARARGYAFASSGAFTVRYTARLPFCYRACGLQPPVDGSVAFDGAGLWDWFRALDADARAAIDSAVGFAASTFIPECLVRMGCRVEEGN
jgi:hypothetical protein